MVFSYSGTSCSFLVVGRIQGDMKQSNEQNQLYSFTFHSRPLTINNSGRVDMGELYKPQMAWGWLGEKDDIE